ncbi:hypothetical protein CAEBREN_08783 [Caenorhabditis brenneri]|uniref:Cap-specific mRNA (nucleoside-2'-O-)-methyltransferase 2 n=1 Tax=Caenorhabditis brenneri TaxID=135651 RepID=G0MWZ2_CAEBE|nr:hypothetical protein CAEBREN_08783 [Caenorhabditis brenneri]
MVVLSSQNVEENPIELMTDEEIKHYYSHAIFDFNDYNNLEDSEDLELKFQRQNDKFLARASEISKIADKQGYDEHTDLLHDFYRNPKILKNYFICKNKAFLKLLEIYDVFGFNDNGSGEIRSFHLCEGPGYFIDATYLAWLRSSSSSSPESTWHWNANTLNPYFENISCFDKLIDDSHLRGHLDKWKFGPTDDGDVKKLIEEDYLEKEELEGKFDLVTADGSTNTQGQEGNIEQIVEDLILAEVNVALKLLRKNGRLIIKMYRFCLKGTRDIMMMLGENFSKIRAIKPMTSRPGSAERYIICDGFGGRMHISSRTLLLCDEFFLRKQLERIDFHVSSFKENRRNFDWNDRKMFMKTMRHRFFDEESRSELAAIHELFPGIRKSSPWRDLYAHNLIRRYKEYKEWDLPKAIGEYVDTATVFPPTDLERSIDVEMMIQYILRQKSLVVSSPAPLDIQDSLFIEPIALQGLLSIKPSVHYDLFQSCSTLNDVPPDDRNLRISDGNYQLEITDDTTIEHVLTVLTDGIQNKMHSFTLTNLPDSGPPLLLSRLSASMYCLLFAIFETMEIGKRQVRWSGLKHFSDSLRPLLTRLLHEISMVPRGSSVRSFIPLQIIDTFHPIICYQNLSRLTVLWPEIQRRMR